MAHKLDGIREKLKRAEQNIQNLNVEIGNFLQAGGNVVLPNNDDEAFQKAADAHFQREIPLRFSVLAGEIVHHLRSCLDHIVWMLSTEAYRRDSPGAIEFPVFKERPTTKKEIARYDRKIEGVTSLSAKAIIQSFQPYKCLERGETVESDLLGVVHDMDRFDKHRELTIVLTTINMTLSPELVYKFTSLVEKANRTDADLAGFDADVKMNAKFTSQVSFREFGDRNTQLVIPGLFELLHYVSGLIQCFEMEFA